MTLSMVAKDEQNGALGAFGAFGACGYTDISSYGSIAPHESLRGAVATQTYVNVDNGLRMMALLGGGDGSFAPIRNMVQSTRARAPERHLRTVTSQSR